MRALLLFLLALGAQAAITGPVFEVTSNAPNGSQTTAAKASTGATLLVVDMSGSGGADMTAIAIADKCSGAATGNNWHHLTQQTSTTITKLIWYSYDSGAGAALVVCASHTITTTFTLALTNSFTGWSGTLTSANPFDVENGANTAGGNATSLATGSITPSQGGELIISSGGLRSVTTPYTTTLTSIHTVAWVSGNTSGLGTAYSIQTSATPVSDTWTMTGSGQLAVVIASFKSASPPAGGVKHRAFIQ